MSYEIERFFYQNPELKIVVIIAAIIIAVGLFFLFRVIALWYFKINKILAELKRTNDYLAKIAYGAQGSGNTGNLGPNGPMQIQQGSVPMNKQATGQAVPAFSTSVVQPAATPVQGVRAEAANIPFSEKPVETVPQIPVQQVCRQCGAVLLNDAAFCVQCGTKN